DKVIRSEKIIQMMGPRTIEYGDRLRVVTIYDERKDECFDIITNDFDFPAETIAALYKSRWGIETFFKWMKQKLNFRSFLGYTENAVKIQIWTALLTYLLVWMYH
ncbi:MAG: IS4 family transposase, partial [Phototrophicales bacterium]